MQEIVNFRNGTTYRCATKRFPEVLEMVFLHTFQNAKYFSFFLIKEKFKSAKLLFGFRGIIF